MSLLDFFTFILITLPVTALLCLVLFSSLSCINCIYGIQGMVNGFFVLLCQIYHWSPAVVSPNQGSSSNVEGRETMLLLQKSAPANSYQPLRAVQVLLLLKTSSWTLSCFSSSSAFPSISAPPGTEHSIGDEERGGKKHPQRVGENTGEE